MKNIIKILILFIFYHFDSNAQSVNLYFKNDSIVNSYKKSKKFESANLMYFFLEDSINQLHKNGYIDAEYLLNKFNNDHTAEIIIKNKVNNITIKSDIEVFKDNFPKTIPYEDLDIQINKWIIHLEKQGQGLGKIYLSDHYISKDTLYTTLNYTPDINRQINEIVIEGYEKFPEGVRRDIVRKFKGKTMTDENLQKLNSYLQQLNFINITKPAEILFEKNKTTTYIYTEKSKNNKFDGYVGFGNNEKRKLQFNGYIDLNLNNIINKGEQTSINWRSDGNKQTNFDFKTEIPYLFKTPIGINFNLNLFRQDSTFQTNNINFGIKYYHNYNTKIGLTYKSNTSTYTTVLNNLGTNYNSRFYTLNFQKLIRAQHEDIFKDKAEINLSIGTGSRITDDSNTKQQTINIYAFYDIKISNKNHIVLKNQTLYLNSKNYLINELYRAGGAQSFRGVNENSLQGNTIFIINTEYRYILNPKLYVNTITDFAHINDKINQTENNLYSYGIGIGIINKTTNVNINYVNYNKLKEQLKNNNFIINITLKTVF